MVCQQSDQEQNIFVNLKPFDMKDFYVFVETLMSDVKMSCTGRDIGLVVLALRC